MEMESVKEKGDQGSGKRKKPKGGKSRSYTYGCLLARDLGDNPRNGHCLTLLYFSFFTFSSFSVTGTLGDLRVGGWRRYLVMRDFRESQGCNPSVTVLGQQLHVFKDSFWDQVEVSCVLHF